MAKNEVFTPEEVETMKADLASIIGGLRREMGRMPTEDEVKDFLWGDDNAKKAVLDKVL